VVCKKSDLILEQVHNGENASFQAVLDTTCRRLQQKQAEYSLKRIQKMEDDLGIIENDLLSISAFKQRIMPFLIIIALVVFVPASAMGRVVFSELDLSAGDSLLFQVAAGGENRSWASPLASQRGIFAQKTLFLTHVQGALTSRGSFPIQQLTTFPERMDLLDDGETLQVRNAFGVVRLSLPGSLPLPVPGFPSFAAGMSDGRIVDGNTNAIGRAEEIAPSNDGRWLLYLHPVSPALGDLVLLDTFSGVKTLVATRLERPEKQFPASWSPDSQMFIYEREGNLYFYIADSLLEPHGERFRLIGEGTINSIAWARGGDFYYLHSSTLYHVRRPELLARAVYADFLNIGSAAGRIPFNFDPRFDKFWLSPDFNSLLVSKGRRSLFYYPLDEATTEAALPHLLLPRSSSEIHVLWTIGGEATVFVAIPNRAGTEMRAWRLSNTSVFQALASPPVSISQASISPDGQHVLLWGEGGTLLYDYASWQQRSVLSENPTFSCLWAGSSLVIIGDDQKIERLTLTNGAHTRELVALSGVHETAFEEQTSRILARNGGSWFVTSGRSPWTAIDNPARRIPAQVSSKYRIFLDWQRSGPFANLPMVRNSTSTGTFPLFAGTPNARALRPSGNQIALAFDLYDDDQGLPEALDALNRLGIQATFFLNGDFIRRHPEAVRAIADAGHESASMFFAPLDLSDSRYWTGGDFVARGLARNEDEFFRVTARELSLLWHAPWYIMSPEIAHSASLAGYTTITRTVDPLDWVSRADEKLLGIPLRTPSQIIDTIVREASAGSVIPIRLGLLPADRNDYLFNRINVLLDALVREGYTISTVSSLIGSFAQE